MKKVELLAPAGGMANLKAAVSNGADAVYLGLRSFSARGLAVNFDLPHLKEAVRICRSNNVKVFLTMNTLVKNDEVKSFFKQLSEAYSAGVDAVIIQEVSLTDLIKKNYPDLKVHSSTQAGVMNSDHANLLSVDRVTLARELTKDEIINVRMNVSKELEVFCHGALCVCVSGWCLFSSLLGGRSGNRGLCAQPCRKKYDDEYYLSPKELCLIDKIPDLIRTGVDSLKIEGRMRTPYYVATVTKNYRKAIDDYYNEDFKVTDKMREELSNAFSRGFTQGWFSGGSDFFNRKTGSGTSSPVREFYDVKVKDVEISRSKPSFSIPVVPERRSEGGRILSRVYDYDGALSAFSGGADIVYLDLFDEDFIKAKEEIGCKLFGVTHRLMLDSDVNNILGRIKTVSPDGLLVGNPSLLKYDFGIPLHLDYNINCFNDFDINFFEKLNAMPIISPELSFKELNDFKNKNFAVLVHGRIKLMTLRHDLKECTLTDEKGGRFIVNKIHNGCEILNKKELGLLGRSSKLLDYGVNNFFIDTSKNVKNIVRFYRRILNKEKVNDSRIKKDYVLGWSYQNVL